MKWREKNYKYITFLLLSMNFKNVNMNHDPRQNNAGKQKSLIKFSLS